jgi:hypothetical protein
MPYQSDKQQIKCVVCNSPANGWSEDAGRSVDCKSCGDFYIWQQAIYALEQILTTEIQRAIVSYSIRKLSTKTKKRPELNYDFLKTVAGRRLPSPPEASDNFLLWVAEQAQGRAGHSVDILEMDETFLGIVGAVDYSDIAWIIDNLTALELVMGEGSHFGGGGDGRWVLRLTGKGWNRVEELNRAHIASQYAFFARRFENAELDVVFERCLIPAVLQTGFELRLATQRAGLIDAIIEDEIRRCRFLIADLSDDNAGAYWEAGFAEGLRKPVIYICRDRQANDTEREKKTHFDTDHRQTVRWNPDETTFDITAKMLKAVIRNTLLGDAKQDD